MTQYESTKAWPVSYRSGIAAVVADRRAPWANEHYGTFEVGQRDELVTALGLATQVDYPTSNSIFDIARTWGSVEEVLG